MQIEIRDITPEEAAPYGENADIVLTGRKTVVFTDADGNVGKLYMKEEDIDLLGKQYIAISPRTRRWSTAKFAENGSRRCHGTHTRTTRRETRRRPST